MALLSQRFFEVGFDRLLHCISSGMAWRRLMAAGVRLPDRCGVVDLRTRRRIEITKENLNLTKSLKVGYSGLGCCRICFSSFPLNKKMTAHSLLSFMSMFILKMVKRINLQEHDGCRDDGSYYHGLLLEVRFASPLQEPFHVALVPPYFVKQIFIEYTNRPHVFNFV